MGRLPTRLQRLHWDMDRRMDVGKGGYGKAMWGIGYTRPIYHIWARISKFCLFGHSCDL